MKSLALVNLAAGLIVFLVLLAKLLPPWAQSRYKVEAPMEDWSTLTLHDPKLGSQILSLQKDKFLRAVLVVNDCGQCNASKVAAFSGVQLAKNVRKLVLISNPIPLQEARERFGHYDNIEFGIMSAPQKAELNASFIPRVYLLDGNSQLKFIQPPSFSYGQAFWSIQKQVRP